MTDDIIIRRLSIIKHLYKLGLEQATLPDTISYVAILSLHDSLDMFMSLAAEKKGLTKDKYLMQYFDSIPELRLKASVNKINKRRNNLKHDGIIPGKIEIEDTCTTTKLFFEENTPIIFNKDFSSVSFFDLITYEKVKEFLKEGSSLCEKNELRLAADEIAKAYFHLLIIEEALKKSEDRNPWYNLETQPLIKDGKFYTKAMEKLFVDQEEIFKEPKIENNYVEISEGVASLAHKYNKAFSYIFQSIEMYSLGLDSRKYTFYISFMPQVVSLDTKNNVYRIGIPYNLGTSPEKFLIKENISFAIGFVTEFALKLQDFNY